MEFVICVIGAVLGVGIFSIVTELKRIADAAERTPPERKAHAAKKPKADAAKRNSKQHTEDALFEAGRMAYAAMLTAVEARRLAIEEQWRADAAQNIPTAERNLKQSKADAAKRIADEAQRTEDAALNTAIEAECWADVALAAKQHPEYPYP